MRAPRPRTIAKGAAIAIAIVLYLVVLLLAAAAAAPSCFDPHHNEDWCNGR